MFHPTSRPSHANSCNSFSADKRPILSTWKPTTQDETAIPVFDCSTHVSKPASLYSQGNISNLVMLLDRLGHIEYTLYMYNKSLLNVTSDPSFWKDGQSSRY